MAEETIIKAIESNDLPSFRAIISSPVSMINYIFDNGLLHYMIKNYPDLNIDFYKVLLEDIQCDINKSANIGFSFGSKETKLKSDLPILLIDWTKKDLLNLFLLNPRLNLTKLDYRTRSIINKAIDLNNKEVLDLFAKKGLINMVGSPQIENLVPLNYAMNTNMEIFKYLLTLPNININKNGMHIPIYNAIMNDNLEAFKLLIDNGVNIKLSLRHNNFIDNESNSNSNNPLVTKRGGVIITLFEHLILENKKEMIEYIIEKLNIKELINPFMISYIMNICNKDILELVFDKLEIVDNTSLLIKITNETKINIFEFILDKLKDKDLTLPVQKALLEKSIKISQLNIYNKLLDINELPIDNYKLFNRILSISESDNLIVLEKLISYSIFDPYKHALKYIQDFKFNLGFTYENKESLIKKLIEHPNFDSYNISKELLLHLTMYPSIIKELIPDIISKSFADDYYLEIASIYKQQVENEQLNSTLYPHMANHIEHLKKYKIDKTVLLGFMKNSLFYDKIVNGNLEKLINYFFVDLELLKALLTTIDYNDEDEFARQLLDLQDIDLLNILEHLADTNDNYMTPTIGYHIERALPEFSNFIVEILHFSQKDKIKSIIQKLIQNHPNSINELWSHSEFLPRFAKNNKDLFIELVESMMSLVDDNLKNIKAITILMDKKENTIINEWGDEEGTGQYYYEPNDLNNDHEFIRSLLYIDNIDIQDYFYYSLDTLPLDLIVEIMNHSSFKPEETIELEGMGLFFPVDCILYKLDKNPLIDSEENKKLLLLLNEFFDLPNMTNLNLIHNSRSYMIYYINGIVNNLGKFDLNIDYLSHNSLNYLAHAVKQILLHPKFDYNINDDEFLTLCLIDCDSLDFINYLLSKPELDHNISALHTVISERDHEDKLELVKILLGLPDIDVNVNHERKTPLHHAILNNEMEIFDLLIEHPGIDLSIQNIKGKTYLQIANKHGIMPMVDKLKAKGLAPDDKQERLEKLQLEYEEKMASQGRTISTRIRDIIAQYESIIKESSNYNDGCTEFQLSFCPFCLLFVEKEDPSECLYIKHKCPVDIRNEELLSKYLGSANIEETFEFCVTCGRGCLNHGHFDFNQPPNGRRLIPGYSDDDGTNSSWVCNKYIGGIGRLEIVARITIILSEIKKRFEQSQTRDQKLVYNKELVKILTNEVDRILSTDSSEKDTILLRAEQIFDRSKLDINSKIPKYARFNASNDELRDIQEYKEKERLKELAKSQVKGKERANNVISHTIKHSMKRIINDGTNLCLSCMEPMPILWQAHMEDTYFLCSADLQAYICGNPYSSITCILGCNDHLKGKKDANPRDFKQIYKEAVEILEEGEFCDKDFSDEKPLTIPVPTEQLEREIERIEEHNGAGSSSSGLVRDEGSSSSSSVQNLISQEARNALNKMIRYRLRHDFEYPEPGELLDNN